MLDAKQYIKPPVNRLLVIDFETYYSKTYSLSAKSYTTSSYVRDPQFQTIGVGVYEPVSGYRGWLDSAEFVEFAKDVDWKHTAVLCHHAHFDGLILSHHYDIRPGLFLDTLSMANTLGLKATVGGSLKKLMEFFQVGQKGTAVHDFIGKRREDFTAREWDEYGEYCLNDCQGTWDIFKKMDPKISTIEVAVNDFTVQAFTDPVVDLDRPLLEAELVAEGQRKAALLERVTRQKEELSSNPKFAQLLLDFGVTPPMKVSPKTGKETFAFAKSDPGMKELLEHPRDEVRWLAEARVGIKSTIAESRIGRMLKLVEGGFKAPIYLRVSAAHTHRWGGGDKTNFQNLPRKGPLRQAIMAPKGHVLIACDSTGIEARGLAWLAEHSELVEAFRKNRDVYSEFASVAYGRKVDRKKNPEDETAGHVGKVCVLGLGYGMSWAKLATTLLMGAMGKAPIQFSREDADRIGVDVAAFAHRYRLEVEKIPTRLSSDQMLVHCAVCKHLVTQYRSVNQPIQDFWYETCDWAIREMFEPGPDASFGPGGVFKVERHGIRLPSGLSLHYPGLRQVEKIDPDTGDSRTEFQYMGGAVGKEVKRLYGGLLTENLTQAFCRDIVAEQVAQIRWKYGYKVVTTTHDEGVFCVPEKIAVEAEKNIIETMRLSPAWCLDLPLNAEAGVAVRYGDC